MIHVGCAGWTLRTEHAAEFSTSGSHLERYAGRFSAVEINSSFYRPHRLSTYERWARMTPASFRFSVKLPKEITHRLRLINADQALARFLAEAAGLGDKLGAILVQLPPSLVFDSESVAQFFAALRQSTAAPIVCEPRHLSWFSPVAEELLAGFCVGRVAADPVLAPSAAAPGGDLSTVYYRWHGSPRVYYSHYGPAALERLACELRSWCASAEGVWCIFDNTALGAATGNALSMLELLGRQDMERRIRTTNAP